MQTRRFLVGAVAVLGLTLAGCSDSEDDTSTDDTQADQTTTEAPDTSAPDTSDTTGGDTTDTTMGDDMPSQEEMEATLSELLVAPADLGPGFIEDEYDVGSGGPCGLDPDEEFSPMVRVGRAMSDAELQLGALHELRVYDSDTTATSAFEAGVTAVSCGTETADPSISLGEVTDVSADVGTDAVAVEITGEGVEGLVIIAGYSDLLAVYQFQGATDADTTGVPNPLETAATNMGVIISAIG